MKQGLFIVFLISVFTQLAEAQTIKTGVLVIGNGSNAIGAGFQSAISGVKTIMLTQDRELLVASLDNNIHSGLEANFLKKMRQAKGVKDSSKVYVDGTSANLVLKTWADSIKNLTVMRNMKWSRIKRSGNNWNVLLADGRTIKAEVLVNATGGGDLNEAIGQQPVKLWQPFGYDNNLYRLSVSAGYALSGSTANMIPLYNFLLPKEENLIALDAKNESMAAGQAAGATAAYAVFFRTKTSLASLKLIQKELINYNLAAVPFADIGNADANWKSIQIIGLSGFLKATFVNGAANFMPEQEVSTAEIREPLKEFYYKAQIWFDDYKAEKMTLEAVLRMVCMVGNRAPENTKTEITKKWKKQYGFVTELDWNRNASRREFAVLVDEYLSPFNVNVDRTGRVIR